MIEFLLLLCLLAMVALLTWRAGEKLIGVALVALSGLAILVASFTREDLVRSPRDDAPLEEASLGFGPIEHEAGYVGSRTCLVCHPGEHASFSSSFHPTMTQHANDGSVEAPFDGRLLQAEGVAMRVLRDGDRYLATIQRAGARPEEVEVVQTTGSHHLQAFWYPTGSGRELGLLPFCYRLETEEWIPVEDAFLLPPGEGFGIVHGQWNQTCHGCHATRVEPRLPDRSAGGSAQTRAVQFGIQCEACHGPGRGHVESLSNPLARAARYLSASDPAAEDRIVNPDDLTAERSSEVCGQCHSVHATRSDRMDQWRTEGHAYRPGDDLRATRIIVQPRRGDDATTGVLRRQSILFPTTFWSDGVVRVSGREFNGLIDSPCYDHDTDRPRMACASCHSMHNRDQTTGEPALPIDDWRDDQLRHADDDQSCLQCHAEFREAAIRTQHTHHQPGSSGASCVNCHMAHTTYGLLKAIRSHTIESPSVQTELDAGRPNACNLCHLDQSLEWTAGHLEDWYDAPKPVLDVEQRELASVWRWSLMGDAGVRALAAWHLGWEPSRQASEERFFPAVIVELLRDDYAAVRALAWRSAGQIGADQDRGFSYTGPAFERGETIRALEVALDPTPLRGRTEFLVDSSGRFDRRRIRALLARRDRRKVYLGE